MRPLPSMLLAAGMLAGNLLPGVAQAEPCTRPAEKAAFDVAGLKSELMVVALACQAQDKYNAFVVRFRSELQGQERTLNGYFSRSFGRSAQKQHDDYITSLANAQSHEGIRSGTLFCSQTMSLFDDVMALKTSTELPQLAATKSLVQPISLTECPLKATTPKAVHHHPAKRKVTRTAAK